MSTMFLTNSEFLSYGHISGVICIPSAAAAAWEASVFCGVT